MMLSIPGNLADRLSELARASGRSESVLAAWAIREFVDRELPTVRAIQRSQEAAAAGKTVPHAQVVREAYAIIAGKRQSRLRRKGEGDGEV
jgi:predicted transcriptional regulator